MILKNKTLLFLVIFHFFVLGCKSAPDGFLLKEQRNSLEEMRSAISMITNGKFKYVSKNGRDFVTPYFAKKGAEEGFNPQTAKERLYGQFRILGDRRPYDVQVQVFVERKTPSGYEVYGEDVGRENELGDQLINNLKSLGKRNAIDDFRPF